MKISFSHIFFCWVWILGLGNVFAQTTVGMGTESPNPNAVLELVSESLDQGFLVPRFTTAQRIASGFTSKLSDKDNGLLVFDTDEGKFYYWYEDAWQQGIATGSLESMSTVWYTGDTAPRNNEGKNGDFYIHALSGDVYRKQNGTFNVIGNMLPQKSQYTAGQGIYIGADNAIVNTGDLDNTNELVKDVSLSGKTLRVSDAGGDHEVNLSTFQTTTLNDGKVLVGNASNIATQVTVSGDATLTNDGTVSVVGLQGRPVTTTAPASGNVLTWNGMAWEAQAPSSGGSGASWFEGLAVPSVGNPAGGVDGDYYYKTDTEHFYRKESGAWVAQGSWFKPSGSTVGGTTITEITTPTLYMGNGEPDDPDPNGRPGDMYYDATKDELYIKESSTKWKKL